MSTSQKHGNTFENFYKVSGDIPGAEKFAGINHTVHDIPADLDPELGMPTSVKAIRSENAVLCMADAKRFVEAMSETGLRLVIGVHEQGPKTKTFHTVLKMRLLPAHYEWLLGDVTLADVDEVRAQINLAQIPVEDLDGEAFGVGKAAAQAAVEALRKKRGDGIVQFNPKIGSGASKERRLQVSVSLSALWEKLENAKDSARLQKHVGAMDLPLVLVSKPRWDAPLPTPRTTAKAA